MKPPPPELPLRRNSNFVRLWTGGAASGLGSSISALAYPLLALSITTSAGLAGLLGLVALTAAAVTRLPAGSLIDRLPLRRVLVAADVLRLSTTAALVVSLVSGHLRLWQLLVAAAVNAAAAVFSEIAHSVALRHVVANSQLPQAFALNEGRGHAISLIGQPAGGLLYAIAPALPLAADLLSFGVSAALSATISHPLRASANTSPRPRIRHDLLTGLKWLWKEPFLRATLFAAAAYQLVFGAATFALIASFTAAGATATSIGALFAVAAAGGILGALATPKLQTRLQNPGRDHGLDRGRRLRRLRLAPPAPPRRRHARLHLLHRRPRERRPPRRPDHPNPRSTPRTRNGRLLPHRRTRRTPRTTRQRHHPRHHKPSHHIHLHRRTHRHHHHRHPPQPADAQPPMTTSHAEPPAPTRT